MSVYRFSRMMIGSTSLERPTFLGCLFTLFLLMPSHCVAADISSMISVARSSLQLNRYTNTFDSRVTSTNNTAFSIGAPLRMIVIPSSSEVVLSNRTGVTSDGRAYVLVPLTNNILGPSAKTTVTLKFSNPKRITFTAAIGFEGPLPEPSTLPLDPGENGLSTLLGVDTDRDTVRDDIQRHIALTYPNSERTRRALRDVSVLFQTSMKVPAGDKAAAKRVDAQLERAIDCLEFVSGDIKVVSKQFNVMEAEYFNTLARLRAYEAYNRMLSGGGVVSDSDKSGSCDFDVRATIN